MAATPSPPRPYGNPAGHAYVPPIRAYGMDMNTPVYLTDDTFRGNTCSNGGAISGLYANFVLTNSVLAGNEAIGWGANPAQAGTPWRRQRRRRLHRRQREAGC